MDELKGVRELLELLRANYVTSFKDGEIELEMAYPETPNAVTEREETEQYEQLPALSEEDALYWSAPDMPMVPAQPVPEDDKKS